MKDIDLCNYADDTTIFQCGFDLHIVLESLERDACFLSPWFENNHMKMEEAECYLLILGVKDEEVSVNVCGSLIKENTRITLYSFLLLNFRQKDKFSI